MIKVNLRKFSFKQKFCFGLKPYKLYQKNAKLEIMFERNKKLSLKL